MAEPDRPSTARMIDHWLGGQHHRPVDVAAAAAFEAAYGPCAAIFRSLRAFLGRAVGAIAAEGVDAFLVFGAGVPTRGNVHEAAPDATVLYTDVDPETVRLGQRLLAGSDRAGYGYGDATDIGTLDPALLHRFVPGWGRRPVGVVFLGLAAFLDDDTLVRTLDELYEAVAPGSWLAIDFDGEELAGHPRALAMMGPAFRMRSPGEFAPLLGRWQPTGEGLVPVARWRPVGEPEPVPDAFHGGLARRPTG
ncbi:SAM-dependent methyltransferase [Micromonospora sp. WMMD1128]|uniref:SAM-dependent methyltransferase n=1 Tax=unclassified Micromonospora TaxID=2617518 RepID=UPI00248C26A8|nr:MULTISPECIES: SAM-dependent methyltransferase [unclassified Micromonospora]WBB76476.1 SAM-dependent methyltransferase [Micromonospora sp. WMMD1128]WFE35740.1 SAM-dependent methyltransferase [Micromonospora sp. WMMD975]